MHAQQLDIDPRPGSHARELDQVFDFGTLSGLDESVLPFHTALGDRRQKKGLVHPVQGRVERRRLIEITRSQLDIWAFEIAGLSGIAHEGASLLPQSGKLSDQFLPVITSSAGDQYHFSSIGLAIYLK